MSATGPDKEIIIHSLDHALAACAAAAELRLPLTLASARGAALQTGPAWFKAVIEAAMAAHPDVVVTATLDCGDEPGAVMAALRAGLTRLRFDGGDVVRARLAGMGAEFVEAATTVLDLLDRRRPDAACRVFLAAR